MDSTDFKLEVACMVFGGLVFLSILVYLFYELCCNTHRQLNEEYRELLQDQSS